jgi:hypothetical protein
VACHLTRSSPILRRAAQQARRGSSGGRCGLPGSPDRRSRLLRPQR